MKRFCDLTFCFSVGFCGMNMLPLADGCRRVCVSISVLGRGDSLWRWGGEVGTKAKSLVLFRRPRRIGNGVVTGFNRTSAKASFKAFPWGLLSR